MVRPGAGLVRLRSSPASIPLHWDRRGLRDLPPDLRRGRPDALHPGLRAVALSVQTTQEGVRTQSVEYGELDVSRVAPGRYELAVTVTDEVTGATVTRSVPVILTE